MASPEAKPNAKVKKSFFKNFKQILSWAYVSGNLIFFYAEFGSESELSANPQLFLPTNYIKKFVRCLRPHTATISGLVSWISTHGSGWSGEECAHSRVWALPRRVSQPQPAQAAPPHRAHHHPTSGTWWWRQPETEVPAAQGGKDHAGCGAGCCGSDDIILRVGDWETGGGESNPWPQVGS